MSEAVSFRVAVARAHALAEGQGDLDAILATMEGEPVYDFYPIGRRFTGMDRTRRYYEHFIANVQPQIVGFEQHSEWAGEDGLVQEYSVMLQSAGQSPRRHRILGVLTFGDRLLSGERLYSDEAFFRTLIGPIWDELEPIP